MPHGLQHAPAEVVRLVAVAQLVGLMLTGRSPGRDRPAPDDASFENHVGFDGRITPRESMIWRPRIAVILVDIVILGVLGCETKLQA